MPEQPPKKLKSFWDAKNVVIFKRFNKRWRKQMRHFSFAKSPIPSLIKNSQSDFNLSEHFPNRFSNL